MRSPIRYPPPASSTAPTSASMASTRCTVDFGMPVWRTIWASVSTRWRWRKAPSTSNTFHSTDGAADLAVDLLTGKVNRTCLLACHVCHCGVCSAARRSACA
jgi:hypothetical protein